MFARLILIAIVTTGLTGMDRQPAAAESTPEPWTHYFGIQDREAQWASFRRGILRNRSGWALIQDTVVGSDEYDARLEELSDRIRTASPIGDLILPVGAVLSGRDAAQFQAYVDLLERDAGETWKRVVRDQVIAASAAAAPDRSLFWQIDNEINSRHMVSSAGKLLGWPDADGFDDPRLVAVYADYVLAPAVEAIESVRNNVTPAHSRIVLGSIANATRQSSEEWMNALLDHRFDGRFAPTLKGDRVADHVDIIAMHYVATRDEDVNDSVLTRTLDRWLGDGAITGVWMTEELGKARARKNQGALTAIRLVAGYTRFAIQHSLTSAQLRCSFWGATAGNVESNAVAGLDVIYEFLGPGKLTDVSAGISTDGTTGNARVYGFRADDAGREIVVVTSVERDRRNAVRSITVDNSAPLQAVEIYEVSAEGLVSVGFRLKGRTVVLDERVKIGPGSAVLALVDRQPTVSE